MHAVEKGVAHRSIFAPIFGEYLFCVFADRNDGDGNKRHARQKHERRAPIDPHADTKKKYGRDHRKEELRQVCGIIQVELFDALHAYLRQARHAHAVRGAHAEAQYLIIGALAQILFDLAPEHIFHRGVYICERLIATDEQIHRPAYARRDADIGEHTEHHQKDGVDDVLFIAADKFQKFFVKHLLSPLPLFLISVCSLSSERRV